MSDITEELLLALLNSVSTIGAERTLNLLKADERKSDRVRTFIFSVSAKNYNVDAIKVINNSRASGNYFKARQMAICLIRRWIDSVTDRDIGMFFNPPLTRQWINMMSSSMIQELNSKKISPELKTFKDDFERLNKDIEQYINTINIK